MTDSRAPQYDLRTVGICDSHGTGVDNDQHLSRVCCGRKGPLKSYASLLSSPLILIAAFLAEPVFPSDATAPLAQARRWAKLQRFEHAIDLLEKSYSTVIGDPNAIEAKALLPKYYLAWYESLLRQRKFQESCRALLRWSESQSLDSKNAGLKDKLTATLATWEQNARKRGTLGPLVQTIERTLPLLGEEGVSRHVRVYSLYLAELVKKRQDEALAEALHHYLDTLKYADGGFSESFKKSASRALVAQASSDIRLRKLENALRYCVLAHRLATPGFQNTKVIPLRDSVWRDLGAWYYRLHDIDKARAYYQLVLDHSRNLTLTSDARKVLAQIKKDCERFSELATLPAEITKDVRIVSIPIPYEIENRVLVKPGVKVTVDKGVHIRGGRIQLQNASMEFKGTQDAPVLLQDLQLGNESQNMAGSTYIGQNVILLRSTFRHFGGAIRTHQQKWLFTQSHIIGPANLGLENNWLRYSLEQSTVSGCDLWMRKFSGTFRSLTLENCRIGIYALFNLEGTNLINCRTLPQGRKDVELKRDRVNRTVWMDSRSQEIASGWKKTVRSAGGPGFKMELIAPAVRNSNSGASWRCPSFEVVGWPDRPVSKASARQGATSDAKVRDIAGWGPIEWLSGDPDDGAKPVGYVSEVAIPHLVSSGDKMAFCTSRETPHIIIDLKGRCRISRIEFVNVEGLENRADTITLWSAETRQGPWKEIWRGRKSEKKWNIDLPPFQAKYLKLGNRRNEHFHLYSARLFGQREFPQESEAKKSRRHEETVPSSPGRRWVTILDRNSLSEWKNRKSGRLKFRDGYFYREGESVWINREIPGSSAMIRLQVYLGDKVNMDLRTACGILVASGGRRGMPSDEWCDIEVSVDGGLMTATVNGKKFPVGPFKSADGKPRYFDIYIKKGDAPARLKRVELLSDEVRPGNASTKHRNPNANLSDQAASTENALKAYKLFLNAWKEIAPLLKKNRFQNAMDVLDDHIRDKAYARVFNLLKQGKADIDEIIALRSEAVTALNKKTGQEVTLKRGPLRVKGTILRARGDRAVSLKLANGPEMTIAANQLDAVDVDKHAPPPSGASRAKGLLRRGLLFLAAGDLGKAKSLFVQARAAGIGPAIRSYLDRVLILQQK